ncbi:MAG TPA: hypothetical protein VGG23_02625, partial [Acidimicrobiales bacterium]
GFDVADRIRLRLAGLDDLAPLFDIIGHEVLAVDVAAAAGPSSGAAGDGPGGEGTALDLDDRPDATAWIEKV